MRCPAKPSRLRRCRRPRRPRPGVAAAGRPAWHRRRVRGVRSGSRAGRPSRPPGRQPPLRDARRVRVCPGGALRTDTRFRGHRPLLRPPRTGGLGSAHGRLHPWRARGAHGDGQPDRRGACAPRRIGQLAELGSNVLASSSSSVGADRDPGREPPWSRGASLEGSPRAHGHGRALPAAIGGRPARACYTLDRFDEADELAVACARWRSRTISTPRPSGARSVRCSSLAAARWRTPSPSLEAIDMRRRSDAIVFLADALAGLLRGAALHRARGRGARGAHRGAEPLRAEGRRRQRRPSRSFLS